MRQRNTLYNTGLIANVTQKKTSVIFAKQLPIILVILVKVLQS